MWYKSSVISHQPQELSYLLFDLGLWTSSNCCSPIHLGMNLSMTQVQAQILYLHPPNRTLLWVGHKPGLPQHPKNCPKMLHMLLPIITIKDDIIQIRSGKCSIWLEDFVHKMMKHNRGPEQPKCNCNALL